MIARSNSLEINDRENSINDIKKLRHILPSTVDMTQLVQIPADVTPQRTLGTVVLATLYVLGTCPFVLQLIISLILLISLWGFMAFGIHRSLHYRHQIN